MVQPQGTSSSTSMEKSSQSTSNVKLVKTGMFRVYSGTTTYETKGGIDS